MAVRIDTPKGTAIVGGSASLSPPRCAWPWCLYNKTCNQSRERDGFLGIDGANGLPSMTDWFHWRLAKVFHAALQSFQLGVRFTEPYGDS